MKSDPEGFDDLQHRLLRLEKQNRRFKQLAVAVLLVPALLLLTGQNSSRKTVEADEFILRDAKGIARARLSMSGVVNLEHSPPPVAQFTLFDESGTKRVVLDGGFIGGAPGLTLHDQKGRARGYFTETDALDLGAVILLEDEQGQLKTRMREGELLADQIEATHVETFDGDGFEAVLGVSKLITPRTGEKQTTSAASLILFDKSKNVIWKAP